MRQAQLLSIFLNELNSPIEKIVSSSSFRAIESIRPYANKTDIKIELDNRLNEFVLTDEPLEDWIEAIEDSFTDPNLKLPGGETANEAVARAEQVLEEIDQDPELSNVIIVTHRNLLSFILRKYNPNFNFDDWKQQNRQDIYLIKKDNEVESIDKISIY